MDKPTKEQIQWFWEQCGFRHSVPFPESAKRKDIPNPERFEKEQWYIHKGFSDTEYPYCGSEPPIDLNNLFKYAPEYIVGVQFGFYLGGVKCEVTYMDDAGFTTVESFIPNTEDEGYREANSKKKAALALFWAIYKAFGGE